MKKLYKKLFQMFILTFLLNGVFYANEKIDNQNIRNTEQKENQEKKDKSGFLPFALPFYMPETSGGIGFYLLYYKNHDLLDKSKKPDEYALYGTVTLKKQYSVGLSAGVFLDDYRYKLSSKIEVSYFPDLFWGIGPNTKEEADEEYANLMLNFESSFLFQLKHQLFIGPIINIVTDDMKKKEANGLLEKNQILGNDGTTSSGLGINFYFDTRNSVFYPDKGFFIDLKGLYYLKSLGSEYNYFTLKIDFRYFLKLYQKHIIAFQSYSQLSSGEVPFQAMPKLGGEVILRGYYQGRFRDKNYTAAQLEYRFPIYYSFSGVLFGGIGQVASKLNDLFKNDIKAAYGLGLRYKVDKKENINIRLDLGLDLEKNLNFYFIIKEAF